MCAASAQTDGVLRAVLHSATVGATSGFAAALAEHAGDLPVEVDTTPEMLATAAGTLARRLPELGVSPDPTALAELAGAAPPGVAAAVPEACSATFDAGLAVACATWAFVSTGFLLE